MPNLVETIRTLISQHGHSGFLEALVVALTLDRAEDADQETKNHLKLLADRIKQTLNKMPPWL